jgi:hypothetical protein
MPKIAYRDGEVATLKRARVSDARITAPGLPKTSAKDAPAQDVEIKNKIMDLKLPPTIASDLLELTFPKMHPAYKRLREELLVGFDGDPSKHMHLSALALAEERAERLNQPLFDARGLVHPDTLKAAERISVAAKTLAAAQRLATDNSADAERARNYLITLLEKAETPSIKLHAERVLHIARGVAFMSRFNLPLVKHLIHANEQLQETENRQALMNAVRETGEDAFSIPILEGEYWRAGRARDSQRQAATLRELYFIARRGDHRATNFIVGAAKTNKNMLTAMSAYALVVRLESVLGIALIPKPPREDDVRDIIQ